MSEGKPSARRGAHATGTNREWSDDPPMPAAHKLKESCGLKLDQAKRTLVVNGTDLRRGIQPQRRGDAEKNQNKGESFFEAVEGK